MPITRPTIQQITERMISDLESRMTGNTSLLPVALLRVLIIVFAFAIHIVYGILVKLGVNILPDQSDLEWTRRHGLMWGVAYKEAQFAEADITFTGTNGVAVPKGTLVKRSSTGMEYETLTSGIIAGGSLDVTVRATIAGASGNWLKDNPLDILILDLVSPISGVNDTAAVTGEITGGQDDETLDAYRARILQRIQRPGSGGSKADYERWALEQDGVEQVWVKPSYWGAGTCAVVIRPAGDGSLASAVQTELNALQPVTANQPRLLSGLDYVYEADEVPMDYTIKIDRNTAENQTLITDAIDAFHEEEGEPGGTLLLSHLRSAIASTGIYDYEITAISVDGVPVAVDDIVLTEFQFPTLTGGGITFQDL